LAEMSTPSDLQALFASIKPRPSPSQDGQPSPYPPPGSRSFSHQSFDAQQRVAPGQPPQQQHPHYFPQHQHGYLNASVSSPLYSPGPANTPPHHGSDIISPNVPTPRGDGQQRAGPDQATSLLNLLKFKQNKPASPQLPNTFDASPSLPVDYQETGASTGQQSHSRAISASDLVASFISNAAATADSAPPQTAAAAGYGGAAESSATNAETQDVLLRLLNLSQTKTEDTNRAFQDTFDSQPRSPEPQVHGGASAAQPSMRVFGSPENKDSLNFEAPQPGPSQGTLFTYSNPFEQLARHTQPKSRSDSPVVDTNRPKKEPTSVLDSKPKFDAPVKFEAAEPTAGEKQPEQKEAVPYTVGEIAQQLGDALSRASREETARAKVDEGVSKNVASAVAEETRTTAVKTEGEEHKEKVKEATPVPHVEPVKPAVNEGKAVDGNVADSWESAEDSAEKTEERTIRVFNFPLRPFISIVVKPDSGKLPSFRDDGIMDVARLKKDFDQLDRCLTSATTEYIIYALAKNGGLRIIRQDDGRDKQIFRFARDRLFNVALSHAAPSTSSPSKEQAVLAIGVSGSVYWAPICRGDDDLFEMDSVESDCLIFPPYPSSDENTSGGQLKTRAKPSSRHTEFFGIGRGKNIYIVSPQFAAHPTYGVSGSQRIVDTEKFFKEHALKISTGKAGKDFTFSEDDTVVASLDKTGRLRFWDIREVDQILTGSPPPEVRTPLATFVTGSPNEKSWPTSVLFIDKLRPFVKALALRYVLVGLKQNHTLQLWDIGLGKAVQEVNFPHEKESDAICSVAYHPSSGIIVVGHPTRNSVYFLHLSAPKYNLQPMSQANYIKRVTEKDATLPKPDSTACLSGIREVSFASKGQLRSLDILPISKSMGSQRNVEEEAGLFEIYAMYSRGVTCLNVKKEDLGWTPENKIIEPVDALKEGYIEANDLQTFPTYVVDEPSINGDSVTTSTTQKTVTKDTGKKATDLTVESASNVVGSRAASPVKPLGKVSADEQSEVTSGADKAKKKKKEKAKETGKAAVPPPHDLNKYFTPAKSTHQTKEEEVSDKARAPTTNGEPINVGITSEMIKQFEKGISDEVIQKISGELNQLHTRFDEERRAWEAASSAKTDQVLRLVSSTLSENVEKNLSRIINGSIKDDVLPAVVSSTSTAINKQIGDAVSKQLGQIFPRELRQVLPEYVSRAVKQQDVLRSISDAVGGKIAHHVEAEFTKSTQNVVTPAIKAAIAHHSETVIKDLKQGFQAQSKQLELQRQQDAAKIDQLTNLVQTLNESHTMMIASHTALQNEVAMLQRQLGSKEPAQATAQPPLQPARAPAPTGATPEEAELNEIVRLAEDGNLEEASVRVCIFLTV
jgi:WD40 repeat protein